VLPLPRRPPIPRLFPYTTLFRSHDPVNVVTYEGVFPGLREPQNSDELLLRTTPVLLAVGWYLYRPNPSPANAPDSSTIRTSTWRSEEHTSELQSRFELVCRLLLE